MSARDVITWAAFVAGVLLLSAAAIGAGVALALRWFNRRGGAS